VSRWFWRAIGFYLPILPVSGTRQPLFIAPRYCVSIRHIKEAIMFPRIALAAAALVSVTTVSAPAAHAFNCAVPGIFSVTKKTVCANPTLTALDRTEGARFATLRAKLGAEAMVAVGRDRRTFLSQRDTCGREVRCYEATYTAQTRLYSRLDACTEKGARKMFCVSRTILRHREDLHRSQ
jgi:hypothetical protein